MNIASRATFDVVLAIAQRENVNTGQVEISPPAESGTAWKIREIKSSFPTEGDSLAIDGTTMQVVDRIDFADLSLPAKLASWGINIHMGVMFGLANQIVLFLVAIGLAAMVVFGYLMCGNAARRATPASSWEARRAVLCTMHPGGASATVGAAALLIGFWLPLVGWTLLAFLILDSVISITARRRSSTR